MGSTCAGGCDPPAAGPSPPAGPLPPAGAGPLPVAHRVPRVGKAAPSVTHGHRANTASAQMPSAANTSTCGQTQAISSPDTQTRSRADIQSGTGNSPRCPNALTDRCKHRARHPEPRTCAYTHSDTSVHNTSLTMGSARTQIRSGWAAGTGPGRDQGSASALTAPRAHGLRSPAPGPGRQPRAEQRGRGAEP